MLELTRAWIASWRRAPSAAVTPDMVNAIEELADAVVDSATDLESAIASLRLSMRGEMDSALDQVEQSVEQVRTTALNARDSAALARQIAEVNTEKLEDIVEPEATPTVFPGTFSQPGSRR